ncbi:MAG: YigZ family protein [Chlorobi bacterium]|nr:YigZ family protein [Chlorobiota bacterium]
MNYLSKINTIQQKAQAEFKEKGSLFVGQVFPIQNSEDAENILSEIRKKYYDATHNCYAYKLISDEDIKYSDDGEPNGTAGIRILNAINHYQLSNVIIISTRYFGGTKLGVGPLGKAYYNSAVSAIEIAEIIVKINYSEVLIEFNYDMTSHVHHFLNQFGAKNIKNLFDEIPKIQCHIKPENLQKLIDELTLVSKGRINITILNENIYL